MPIPSRQQAFGQRVQEPTKIHQLSTPTTMVKRKKDDEDKEDTEKTTGYQDMNRTVNVIFGGETRFLSKQA